MAGTGAFPDWQIADFTYELPDDRVARYPEPERDASRLLVMTNAGVSTGIYFNLANYLQPGSLLVFNDTRVIRARLLFPLGQSVVELFCLEPVSSRGLQEGSPAEWKCLVGNSRKWKQGELSMRFALGDQTVELSAVRLSKENDHSFVRFEWTPPDLKFSEILHTAGALPIPPYLRREAEASDNETYQTIFAAHEGSVAAPTAALHFTDRLMQRLAHKGIRHTLTTLHVGAGTFRPVKTAGLREHDMHSERIVLTRPFIDELISTIRQGLPVVAVGTTSLRTIESCYWLGANLLAGDSALSLGQWAPYEAANEYPVAEALQALKDRIPEGGTLEASTRILIAPGYPWKIVSQLITNFHQPGSTLLLLVAAFIGDRWKEVYNYALANGFRFLSYGDGCLLSRQ